MSTASQEAPKLKVFVSYSRDDLEFADQLVAGLTLCGFEPLIDRTGISGGEAWQQRLGNLIRDADTVAFVLSRASATSPICGWEVEEAVRLSKRILPVVCGPLEGTSPPSKLQDLNYIMFYRDAEVPGSGFGVGLAQLVAALNTDVEWIREHTRLLVRASEWATGGRPVNRLLSGNDIVDAKAWAARRPKDAPEPTNLHLDFILASEQAEAARAGAEQKRLAEIAAAQGEREKALKAAEIAQQEKAEASQRLVKRTVMGLVVAVFLAIVASALGVYAILKQQEAQQQAELADRQRERAEQNLAAINQALEVLDNTANPEVLAAKFFDLARNYASQDRLEEAVTLYKRSLGIIEKGQRADSADAAAVRAELGIAYEKQNKLADSEPLLRQALAFHETSANREHPHVAVILMHLANILRSRGEGAEAEKLRSRAHAIARSNALAEFPVFFATDREQDEDQSPLDSRLGRQSRLGYNSERGRRLDLGQANVISAVQVSIAEHLDLAASADRQTRAAEASDGSASGSIDVVDLKKLAPVDFSAAARERLARGTRYPSQALIVVHGYSTSFDLAVRQAAKITQLLKFDGTAFVYSWPSAGAVGSYTYDRESAGAAAPFLNRFIELVRSETGAKAVNIIAYGMGCPALLDALQDLTDANPPGPPLVNEVILLAPDVDADSFANLAAGLSGRVNGITLYASANDATMRVSRSFWGSWRAGDVPPEGPTVVKGVDTIDVSALGGEAFNLDDSRSPRIERNRVLRDVESLLMTGMRPPHQRSPELLTVQAKSGIYWQMRP